MRHDLLSCAMTGRSRCMLQPPTKALLIALAGRSLRPRSRLSCAAARTINLATVAVAADQNWSPAPNIQKSPRRSGLRFRRLWVWTRTATNGILPRHTCSARCRGTAPIRDLAVAVVAVPVSISPTGRSNTVCPRHAEIARASRGGLWICGQRKGVAHIPTGPTTIATSFNLMNSKTAKRTGRF